MSKFDELIDQGDARGILREWAKTERAANEGRFCECSEPDLTGRKSHLCFGCGLYNLKRKAEIEAAMVAPHPFEPRSDLKHPMLIDLCCDFCSQARNHPRHAPDARAAPRLP